MMHSLLTGISTKLISCSTSHSAIHFGQDGWMVGVNGILSTQEAATSCPREFKVY